MRACKRNHIRKLVITIKNGKEEIHLGKVPERGKEKRINFS